MPQRETQSAIAIDLFAGAGGLSLGLGEAGFEVVTALDNDAVAVKSYREALGDHIFCAPIEEISAAELMRRAGIVPGECDLLAGGPPCQGFSLQRRGERIDPRNRLVLDFIRMVEEVRPSFFLMENVSGLLSKHGRPFLEEFNRRVARLGYVIHIELLNASDFGVPQRRRRALLIGERTAGAEPRFRFPDAIEGRVRTVRDAIADLPSPPGDGISNAPCAVTH